MGTTMDWTIFSEGEVKLWIYGDNSNDEKLNGILTIKTERIII